jgi:hypothetical protein
MAYRNVPDTDVVQLASGMGMAFGTKALLLACIYNILQKQSPSKAGFMKLLCRIASCCHQGLPYVDPVALVISLKIMPAGGPGVWKCFVLKKQWNCGKLEGGADGY